MDVDMIALGKAQQLALEVNFMKLCGEAVALGLTPSKAAMAQQLLQDLQSLGYDEALQLMAVHAEAERPSAEGAFALSKGAV